MIQRNKIRLSKIGVVLTPFRFSSRIKYSHYQSALELAQVVISDKIFHHSGTQKEQDKMISPQTTNIHIDVSFIFRCDLV